MWNTLNRIGNTVSIPGRLLKTWLTASADVFDTLAAIPKDMKNIVSHTSSEIKNVFKSAWTKGKRYQRIGNKLLSPFVALWVAVEWAVRSVVTPATNFVVNTFKTWKNIVNNTINSTFGSAFSKNPVSDFRYEELKTANVIEKNKNWFSRWRFSRKVFQDNTQEGNIVNNTRQLNEKADENINNEENRDATNWTARDQSENEDSAEWTADSKEENEENPEGTTESVQENSEHRWVDEAKRILSDSTCGKIIIDKLCERHNDFWIIFDNTTADGKCGYDHTITIWTKMPNGIKELAPFNREARNPEIQKKHLLLHELSHCTVGSHSQDIPGVQEWLDIIKQYIEARKNIDWKTLSLLSYRNDTYETSWKKAREDFVEMLALRMNWNWDLCKKYLKLLSDEEHRDFRESHWLATITIEHAVKLQNILDSIVRYYENLSN